MAKKKWGSKTGRMSEEARRKMLMRSAATQSTRRSTAGGKLVAAKPVTLAKSVSPKENDNG